MLKQLTIIDQNNKPKRIGIKPQDIKFIEEIDKESCNIVTNIQGKDIIYKCNRSYTYLYQFTNFGQFNIFNEN
jgi:hypothetical protein